MKFAKKKKTHKKQKRKQNKIPPDHIRIGKLSTILGLKRAGSVIWGESGER